VVEQANLYVCCVCKEESLFKVSGFDYKKGDALHECRHEDMHSFLDVFNAMHGGTNISI
jgi:hypothetical protein